MQVVRQKFIFMPSLAYLWEIAIGMKMTKDQLTKLLSQKITENLAESILEQTKKGLELKLEESGFDMDDFFFSDAEAAARADMEKHYGDKMVHAKLGDKEDTKSWLQAQMDASDADVDKHAPHLKNGGDRTFNQKLVDFISKDPHLGELRSSDPHALLDVIGLAAYKYLMDHNASTPFISALQGWLVDFNHEFDPTAEDMEDVNPSAYRLIKKFEQIYNREVQARRLNEALIILEGEPIARYYPIVFLQGEEADETMGILNDQGEQAALEHLLQTYYGEGPERALDNDQYKGRLDHEYRQDIDGETYIMNWNSGIPYVGLTQMKMVTPPDLSNDKYNDLYGDLHGTEGKLDEAKGDKVYEYHINLNERGLFYADVRDNNGNSVYEIKIGYGEEEDNNPIEDGFMKHVRDIAGLEQYLKEIGIISAGSKIVNPYGRMEEGIDDEYHLDSGELSDDPSSFESMETINDVSKGYYVVPPKGDDPLWYVVDQDGDPVSGHNTEEEAKQAVQSLESDVRSTDGLAPEDEPEFGVDFKESRMERIDRLMNEALALIKEYGDIGGYPVGADSDPRAPWKIDDIKPAKKSPKQVFSLTDDNKECVILHHGGSYYAFFKGGLSSEESESIAIDYIGVPSEVDRDEQGYYTTYDAREYSQPSNLTGDAITDYVNDNYRHMKIGNGLADWEDGNYDLVKIDHPLARELKSTWTNLSVPIS